MKYETKPSPDSSASSQAAPVSLPEERPRPEEARKSAGSIQIQVFATRDHARAQALTRKLQDLGLAPVLEKAELPSSGTWYRVRIGGYETPRTARAAGEKLRSSGLISELWLVRR